MIYPQADMTAMADSAAHMAMNKVANNQVTGSVVFVDVGGLRWRVIVSNSNGSLNVKTAFPTGPAQP